MGIKGKSIQLTASFTAALCCIDFKWSRWASLILRSGENHNDTVTQTYTCANIFLSHWQRAETAYHSDGRLDSRDLASPSAGSGIKQDACFLLPLLSGCHLVSSSKCQAFSVFSIKGLRDAAGIQRESFDKERQTFTVTRCSFLSYWLQSHFLLLPRQMAWGSEQHIYIN